MTRQIAAGVIGVGAMGHHHARVYNELPGVDLVGVTDTDRERAADVAGKYGTTPTTQEDLLTRCDAVSVAVPTRYHYGVAAEAIGHNVDLLVEKPFVSDIQRGRKLIERARRQDVTLQVGHVERFNPAVQALADIVPDLEIIAVDVRRLGPPVDRDTRDSVVMDLMIHDIDILLSIVSGGIEPISAVRARDRDYVTAQFALEGDVVASLTASRVTQEKVRKLSITARDCRVNVDYENQSVQIHRHSLPEYYEENGDLLYRQESIIERPTIENGEPLKAELETFVEASRTGTRPPVTAEHALEALEIARQIDELANRSNTDTVVSD